MITFGSERVKVHVTPPCPYSMLVLEVKLCPTKIEWGKWVVFKGHSNNVGHDCSSTKLFIS